MAACIAGLPQHHRAPPRPLLAAGGPTLPRGSPHLRDRGQLAGALPPHAQAALARDPRLQLVPLPTHAPWLNNIEQLWRWLKQRVTHAHPWSDDIGAFKAHVRAELARVAHGPPELRRYCGRDSLFSS